LQVSFAALLARVSLVRAEDAFTVLRYDASPVLV
jgi:hypothetical protein